VQKIKNIFTLVLADFIPLMINFFVFVKNCFHHEKGAGARAPLNAPLHAASFSQSTRKTQKTFLPT